MQKSFLRIAYVSSVFFGVWLLAVPQSLSEAGQPPRYADLSLLQANERIMAFTLETPGYQLQQIVHEQATFQRLSVSGWGRTGEPGWPELPVRTVLLAVPLEAAISLDVAAEEEENLPLRHRLAPATSIVVEPLASRWPRLRVLEFVPDRSAYQGAGTFPETWASLGEPFWIRQQRVVAVYLTPFRYRPATDSVRTARRLRVTLRLTYPTGQRHPSEYVAPLLDPHAPPLDDSLLNGAVAARWRVPFGGERPPGSTSATWQPTGHKVFVDRDGLYRLTYTETLAAGFDVNADPRTFALHVGGQKVALFVSGESDDTFDPQDEIIFYGQQAHTRLTDRNAYWLESGGADGLRMATRDGHPSGNVTPAASFTTTLPVEENHIYSSITPRGEGHDHWFWDYVLAYGSAAAKTFPFTLTQVASEPFTATIRGVLAGVTSLPAYPDHHTRVFLNSYLVDDATWDGQTLYAFTGTVPANVLVSGQNAISVALPYDLGQLYDYVYADRFELSYRRTFTVTNDALAFRAPGAGRWQFALHGLTEPDAILLNVTDPLRPTRIVSATVQPGAGYTLAFEAETASDQRFAVAGAAAIRAPLGITADEPSNLRSTANGADYVTITHRDFYTSVLPLRDHRAAQGMRVQVIRVQDIYDEFNFGLPDAEAVRDFIRFAYDNWEPPAPAYVLLVGDGTLDPKDYLHTGVPSYIPPYLAAADPWINETAADNRYAAVHGDDAFPDLFLGRLPANSPAEATAMVSKILAYEQHPPAGEQARRVLFVADNADAAGDYAAFSDQIAALLPPGYLPDRAYLGVTHTTAGQTRAAITGAAVIGAINSGRLLVHYAGHASYDSWADEAIFGVADLPSLTNAETWPVMLPMTCYDGFYHYPTVPSLGESIVRMDGKGAIASWSPTGLGVQTGHEWLAEGFFDALFNRGITRLGPATTAGILNLLASTPNFHELIDTYVLFGDPALRLTLSFCNELGSSDANCDCRVDVADVQAIAARWHTHTGDDDYRLQQDANADGAIDVADVMGTASDWNRTCQP